MDKQEAIGFAGSTLVTGFVPGTTEGASDKLEALDGIAFDVATWTGSTCAMRKSAVVQLPALVEVVSMEINGTKFKCGLDQQFAVVNYRPYDVSEGRVVLDPARKLALKRARDLRSGDMIFCPGAKDKDKSSGLTYSRVSKHRVQHLKVPERMYSLGTMEKLGMPFLLPGNIVTSSWKDHG